MIIFVHSSGLGAAQWMRLENVFVRMGATHPRMYLDLTGYGATPFDPSRGALEQDVEWVIRAIEEQRDEVVHLVGHSYGGFVALGAAAKSNVASLTLIEPVALWLLQGDDAQMMGQVIDNFEAHLKSSNEPETKALRGFIEYWSGLGSFDAMPGTLKNAMIARASKIIAEVRDTATSTVDVYDLGSQKIPFHILLSQGCRVEARAMCNALSLRLHTLIHTVPGAHMSPVTHPDATAKIILSLC